MNYLLFSSILLLTPSLHAFNLDAFSKHIDSHQEEYVEALREWVAVESDSSDALKRPEVEKMMEITAEKLRKMGGKVDLVDIGNQELPNGKIIPLPKVVTAQFGNDPKKRTVCVYGHVDVQPAKQEDGWATEPYNLTDINGNLHGRGASDNKAPVLAWIHAVEAYQALNIELPVNVKYIIEGMEETGSNGLDAMVSQRKDTFFSDIDYIIISDCGWLSRRPALTYGTRGNCYFFAEVEGPKQDLHSGVYGGTVIEPMTDLIGILDTLINPSGRILIPGINEAVAPLTDEERNMYENIQFDMENYRKKIGVDRLMYSTKEDVLAHRWRYPTVSIHGIEGAFSASGSKTVIPAKVIAKFSIRQVPDMDPSVVEKQVTDYLNAMFAKRNSPNKLRVQMIIGAKPWVADINDPLYEAGKKAVKKVFGEDPDMIREGGTIPVAKTFEDVTGKRIIMLPIGGFDDGLHSQNEKMSSKEKTAGHRAEYSGTMVKLLVSVIMLYMSSEVTMSPLDDLFQYIDGHQDDFVQTLKQWVGIKSDSSDPRTWNEVERILNVTAVKIRDLGGIVEFADVGKQQMPNGESIPIPPVILAEFKKDPKKPTLCIYGHVDVQPAEKKDGWATDPYTLTEVNGNLYGRGATDNKGPVLAWIHAVETYQAMKKEIPVNLKFIIEGMEEVGSTGLETLVKQRNDSFFADVNYIVISDNVWVSKKPALTYGTRGNTYFLVEVEGQKQDMHSGVFGGSVHEPLINLIALLGSLVDSKGTILIPGINEAVAPLTEEERKLYEGIDFDLEEHKNDTGVTRFLHDTKEDILMSRWRYPALSIHGIEGAFSAPGTKTVIPRKVTGKFSIRQVPNMDPPVVERQVTEHLQEIFAKQNSPNKLKVTMVVDAKPWMADLKDPQYVAGQRAVKTVFGVEPDLIREGSTIPIARNFQEITGKSVMMLPIGGADDGEHSQNEKISRSNYIQGTKLFAAYVYELSQV